MVDFSTCLFMFAIVHVKIIHTCPNECACEIVEDIFRVNCSHKKLTTFPSLLDLDLDLSREHPDTAQKSFRKVHLLLSGNRFRYLLRTRLAPVESQLGALEVENNHHHMDVTPDILAAPGLVENMEILRLGPLRDDICNILNRMHAFRHLREVSLTGTSSAYIERKTLTHQTGDRCVLETSSLPSTLRVLHLVNCGTVVVTGEPSTDLAITHLRLAGLRFRLVPRLVSKLMPSSLKHLDLSRNLISSFWLGEALGNPTNCKLETLNLSYNRLSILEDGMLQTCDNLRELDLSHNSYLHVVAPGSLRGLSGLTFDLSYTKVSSLEAISPDQVSVVRVFDAELVCHCDILTGTFLTPEGNSMIQGTCRRAHAGCKGQTSEVSVEEFILECSRASGDIITSHSGPPPHELERGCSGNSGCRPDEKVTKLNKYNSDLGKDDCLDTAKAISLHSNEDQAAEFSPVACSVCLMGCVIHGLLLLAVLFKVGRRVRK